jgi:hypothetical protein
MVDSHGWIPDRALIEMSYADLPASMGKPRKARVRGANAR